MSFPSQTKPPTVKEVWKGADETLRKVDRSFIITNHESRPFPQFTMSDLTLDSMLGKGGFSVVSEVVKIHFSEGVDDVASRPAPPGEIVDDADEHDPVLLPVKENPQPTQLENDPAPMITSTFQLLDDSCANTVFEKDPHDMPSNVSKVT